MGSEKRLAMLEKITGTAGADSFAWYGLALEYLSFKRCDEALVAFETLRTQDPDYVAMYLMCGTMLVEQGKPVPAREWLESGLLRARKSGNGHAVSELEEAIMQLPPPPSTS